MFLWEQIVFIAASIILVVFSVISLFGKTGRISRTLFFIGSLLFAWFFFRFSTEFPGVPISDAFYSVDVNIALSTLPLTWFLFSVVFAREDYIESLKKYKLGIMISVIFGLGLAVLGLFYPFLIMQQNYPEAVKIFVSRIGQWYFLYMIIMTALTMINFESTYRASWGVYRRKLRPSIFILGICFL